MGQGNSGKEVSNTQQTSRWHKYESYSWQLDLTTQEFSCEPQAMKSLFGYSQPTISAKELLKRLPPAQRNKAREVLRAAISTHRVRYFHCCIMTPDSLFSYVEFKITVEEHSLLKGTLLPCLVIPSDIVAAEIFYAMFENFHHGMLVTDEKTRILACNRHFEKSTGYVLEDIIGKETSVFNAEKLSSDYYKNLWDGIENNGHWSGLILTKRADGSTFPQKLTIHKVSPGNGESYFLGLGTDLSDHLQCVDDRQAGGVDLLTQLPTSDAFLNNIEDDPQPISQENIQIILALQPQFPEPNAQETKRQFASYLLGNKLISHAGYIGDDRFAVVMKVAIADKKQGIRLIRQAIKTFFQSFKHSQSSVALSLKQGLTGVSIRYSRDMAPKQLLSHAVQALLELHSGQDKRVAFYDRNIHEQVERKKCLEIWVEESIENDSLQVFFQPIVDIKQGRIDKFEALCRFPKHPQIQTSTQELINTVEDIDKIVELDDALNKKALSCLPELQSLFGQHVGISINRSFNAKQDIMAILRHTTQSIDDSGIPANKVTIEFTESAYFAGDRYQEELLASMRKAGVLIAVDDFGTGFTSFDYLNKSYFDVLKIDQSLIQGIGAKTRQYHVVNAIVQLAQKLKLKVVVEGVETLDEYIALRDLGVDCIQGYFFSKPLSIDELRNVEDYCTLPVIDGSSESSVGTISELVTPNLPRVDPGESLSLIYTYFSADELNVLPVVETNQCVGLVDRVAMNLHMTPSMGTDHETNKENSIWQKAVHRMMSPPHAVLDWRLPLGEVKSLLKTHALPWVLVDSDSRFKGLVEQERLIQYLVGNEI
ncbi:EAL domain-containing protein [Vibrio aquimaris]|uniref:Oxygen sensor protein DosP n=1 Tax=Vibrio aquimaris TaxID=2587862 RepID=A0A5P9CJX5_9VIBR|nr:EAL domain-containing protein [Vibrio aquimaris]QFT26560.1 Oxygen sensor protein DosP [Vibrio aquimaris]